MRVWSPLILVAVAGLSGGYADTELRQRTLVDLTGVDVVVPQISADAESAGVSRVWAETFVESELRSAGIPVLDVQERLQEAGFPYLLLSVMVIRVGEHPLFAYSVRLDVHQTVLLDRDRRIHAPAPTWSATAKLGYAGGPKAEAAIKEAVGGMVREFVQAYSAANQGQR